MISWKLVTSPKKVGGLGVIDIQAFNLALLSKWLWKWADPASSIWKNTIASFHSTALSPFPTNSIIKKALVESLFIFQTGLLFDIGSGASVLFWHYNWGLGILKYRFQELFTFAIEPFISVLDFYGALPNPYSLFNPILTSSMSASSQLASLVGALNIMPTSCRFLNPDISDVPVWKLHGAGQSFTTSSTYNFIKCHPKHGSLLTPLWSFKIPPRFKIFLWQLFQNRLPTLDILKKKGWSLANRCILCKAESETVQHMFSHCAFFQGLWFHLSAQSSTRQFLLPYPVPLETQSLLTRGDIPREVKDISGITYFIVWRERCSRIFRGSFKSYSVLVQEILQDWIILR